MKDILAGVGFCFIAMHLIGSISFFNLHAYSYFGPDNVRCEKEPTK